MVAQSPELGAHVLNARAFRVELEFRNVGFLRNIENWNSKDFPASTAIFKDFHGACEPSGLIKIDRLKEGGYPVNDISIQLK